MRTPVKPTPGKVIVVPAIPECNFCQDGTPGPYDFKTRMGPWANGCERHWQEHRSSPELGVGLGQLWVTAEQVLADELVAAENALAYVTAAEVDEGGVAERVILAQNDIFAWLDFDLNETEQGLTQKASDALDAFVDEYATRPTESHLTPKFNEAGDPLCPVCGHGDVGMWAEDGESDQADFWQCERFSGGCGAHGSIDLARSS